MLSCEYPPAPPHPFLEDCLSSPLWGRGLKKHWQEAPNTPWLVPEDRLNLFIRFLFSLFFFQIANNTRSNKCKRLILMAISNLQVLYCRFLFAIDSFYAQFGYILFPLPVPAQPSPSLPTGPLTLNRDWTLTYILFPSYISCKSLIAKGSSNNRRVFKYICARSYFHSRYSDGKDLSSSCE